MVWLVSWRALLAFAVVALVLLSGCASLTKPISEQEERIDGMLRNWTENATAPANITTRAANVTNVSETSASVPGAVDEAKKKSIYELTGCGTINESGIYTLWNDLLSRGTCFEIRASNVTIECLGHSVRGTGVVPSYAFDVRAPKKGGVLSGVKISECEIVGFSTGVFAENVDNLTLLKNNITENAYGIVILGATNSFFSMNTIKKSSYRSNLDCSYCTFTYNSMVDEAMKVIGGVRSKISLNTFSGSSLTFEGSRAVINGAMVNDNLFDNGDLTIVGGASNVEISDNEFNSGSLIGRPDPDVSLPTNIEISSNKFCLSKDHPIDCPYVSSFGFRAIITFLDGGGNVCDSDLARCGINCTAGC